ncbi:N-acetylglucosamine kinase [Polaribacter batillariae]|uniref:N-acetylglucosamine kinase n=1 Tax=Polaribacter batillariae TaxID=2808900 RepID=A0ABX7SWE7_9FLAO|nr:N-acetylglucosamine kinase [Polaribacter batillariae]QTD37653.1 N-acetylglucosamine kinase [Polaribacter batillariae]
MIIIADSGSTKCDWAVVDGKKEVLKIRTAGINPRLISETEINNIINGSNELEFIKDKIYEVCFYGAGCASEKSKNSIKSILKKYFNNAKNVLVKEDLSAAVFGTTTEAGVVCILGTGSNCCYFDGKEIHVKQASLGYSVMDEGSGNYFGKKLLNAYFYNKMPLELHEKFKKSFDLSLESVLKGLYENENPSAFLASFASFLIKNKSEPYIMDIIRKGIKELFSNLIMCYKEELKTKRLYFVGSIAYYLQVEIIEEAKNRNISVRSFVRRPIDNIIENMKTIDS